MAKRSRPQEEPENLDRWLVSYADFITLLFAFFVILYALSSVNEGKYRVLSDSLEVAFKAAPRSPEPIQVGTLTRAKNDSAIDMVAQKPDIAPPPLNPVNGSEDSVNLKQMANQIEQALAPLIDKEMVNIRRSDNWLEVEINTAVLFHSGSADLSSELMPALMRVAAILKPFPNPINVEGFTDNIPIGNVVYPSNWVLSAARAANVVQLLSQNGIDPSRLSAIGYGEFRPLADNSTPEGRSKNRRIVMAVLARDYSMRVQRGTVAPADVVRKEIFPTPAL